MSSRTIRVALALALAALALPAGADAVLTTITAPADPNATASCPGSSAAPCTVVSRTTAMQVQVGNTRAPFKVTATGRLVGWQITLSVPSASQIRYFDVNEGGPAEAALAVLRPVKGLDYRLDYESPVVHLQPYFGHTATFALASSIEIHAGDVIALAVPTWAPALELTAGRKSAWRASRPRAACANVTLQTAQTQLDGVAEYYCIYRTALIDYGAIEITTP